MYPTRIIGRGFKRGDFDVALDRATVITGDNFAGKTQILDAVRLALIGYLPELGNKPNLTFQLASAPRLEVQLHLSDGSVLSRAFWASGNSVKSEHHVPASLKDGALLPVMLNAEEYFGMGLTDRTRYVFANCPVEAIGRDGIKVRVAGKAPDYPLNDVFAALDRAREKAEQDGESPWTPQQDLEFLLAHVADHWKSLGHVAEMHQGAINSITTQRASEEPDVPMATLEEEKGRVTRAIAEINERIGRHLSAYTQMKSDARRREVIDREIQHGTKAREQLTALKDKWALLDAEVGQLNLVSQKMMNESVSRGSAARAAVETFTKGLRAAKETREIAEKQLAALDSETCCPYCHAVGEGWKDKKRKELTVTCATITKTVETFTTDLANVTGQFEEAVMNHKNLMAELQRQNGIIANRNNAAAAVANLEPTMVRYQTLGEERDRLMPDDPNLTGVVETIQTELNIKNGELRSLDTTIARAQGRANDAVRMATAEKERDAANALKLSAAEAGKELKAVQAETVAGAFRPLINTANQIFKGVLPFNLEYMGGEIGARKDGLWRGHKTMSGLERALTYCAIQMALASRAPLKVAVLDEMFKLRSERVPGFARRVLDSIHSGLVDQVLIIDPERGHLYAAVTDEKLSFKVVNVQ